jgi:hypothetical protein
MKSITRSSALLTGVLSLPFSPSLSPSPDVGGMNVGACVCKGFLWSDAESRSVAPEVIDMSGHSVKSDIWSLGCTCVEVRSSSSSHPTGAPWPILALALFHVISSMRLFTLRSSRRESRRTTTVRRWPRCSASCKTRAHLSLLAYLPYAR